MSKLEKHISESIVKDYEGSPRRYFSLGKDGTNAKRKLVSLGDNVTQREVDAMDDVSISLALFNSGLLDKIEEFDNQFWFRTIYKV
jgi:hypothetical protein